VHSITFSLVGVEQVEVFPLLDLPPDMQRVILGYVPLPDLARLACVSKELRTAYVERVTKRDATVAALLGSHFVAAFREGLSPAHTGLPWDLIVDPLVRDLKFIKSSSSLEFYIAYNWCFCVIEEVVVAAKHLTLHHMTSHHEPISHLRISHEGRRS
jgi:hypothetical protein